MSAFKLANTLGKDFETVSESFRLLEQAGLIRFLWPKQSGKAALRNPAKIYPENTNFIHAAYMAKLNDALIGKMRETFALNQLQNAGFQVYYPTLGDFQVDGAIFEVGGKNKTNKQIETVKEAYILADGIVIGHQNFIPLYLLGFLD